MPLRQVVTDAMGRRSRAGAVGWGRRGCSFKGLSHAFLKRLITETGRAEVQSHSGIFGKSIPLKGTATAKVLRWDHTCPVTSAEGTRRGAAKSHTDHHVLWVFTLGAIQAN